MHSRRRRPPPPWERYDGNRRRRGWAPPAAHAPTPEWRPGGAYGDPGYGRRYLRVYDGEPAPNEMGGRHRTTLERIRQNPMRTGLIGLAVAGTAAPIAVNRHQQAMRTDPTHEDFARAQTAGADDASLARTWNGLESEAASAAQQRESFIEQSLSEYADYGLTRELAEEIYEHAEANAIEPEVAFGLVRAESSFKNSSTSPVGAVGLTQLMPRTADWLEPGVTTSQLRDPGTNLRIGFKYLRSLIEKYDGDTSLALVAYNRGPGTVDREIRNGRDPDNGYADFVFGNEDHGHSLYTN